MWHYLKYINDTCGKGFACVSGYWGCSITHSLLIGSDHQVVKPFLSGHCRCEHRIFMLTFLHSAINPNFNLKNASFIYITSN